MGEKRSKDSIARTYLVSPASLEQMRVLGERYGLSQSDIVRRGIEFVYDYLINDKLPPPGKTKTNG